MVSSDNYTVSYENNINAGTATVKVEGRGNYTGNLQTTFVIAKADRSEFNVQLSDWTYGQTANTPSVSNFGLEEGDVTYSYGKSELGPFDTNIPKEAGSYYVRAEMTETDNYESAVAISEFTIRKAASPDLPEELETLSVTWEMKVLSDIKLPEGWIWQYPDMPLVAGKMCVTVVYMGEDRASYEQTVFEIDIDVSELDNTENPGEGEEPPVVEPDDPDEGNDGKEEPPVVDPDESDEADSDDDNNFEENNPDDRYEPTDEENDAIAVAVGVTTGVVGIGAVGGVALWFVRRRRRL